MIGLLALSVASAAAQLEVDERVPLGLLIVINRASPPVAGRSEITVAARGALRRHTNFALTEVRGDCEAGHVFTCWATTATSARFLMIASAASVAGEDRISTVVLDTVEARKLAGGADADRVEDLIYTGAVVEQRRSARLADSGGLDAYFDGLIAEDFRAVLMKDSHGRPPGSVALELARDQAELFVDQRRAGVVRAPSTRVDGLRAGRRRLWLEVGGRRVWAAEVEVEAGRISEVVVAIEDVVAPPVVAANERWVSRVGGSALAIAGAGVLIYAAAETASTEVDVACTTPDCSRSVSFFARFCDYVPASERDPCTGARSILVAPLGYSLALAGALIFAGGELTEEAVPWWALAAGLVAGVALYGVSAAVD